MIFTQKFKFFFLFIFLYSFTLNLYSQTGETEFTYIQGPISTFGKSKREVIDVAICIDEPGYKGMKLTKIKAYISTLEGISNTSIWLSKELNLQNNKNIPDIGSFEIEPVESMLESRFVGLLEYNLEEPYILNGEPLYIGYSITVDDNSTDNQKKPVILSDNVNPNGLFLHMSKSIMKWMEYSESAQGVAYIVATLEGNLPEYSLDLIGYEEIFAERDKTFKGTFTVSNKGVKTIDNINYVYTIDNGKEIEGYSEFLTGIEPGIVSIEEISLTFDKIAESGPHDLSLKITKVNDKDNEAISGSLDCIVNVMPFVPIHRPLVEEYTGLWCGWCPRGYLAMEMIGEDFKDNQVSICYHSGDGMEVTNDFPIYVEGWPKASVDREKGIDPYYGSYTDTEFGISIDIQNASDKLALASIELEANLDDEKVNVISTTKFIKDIKDANFEVGYVLVCNGLTDKSWVQTNDYSGLSGFNNSPLYELTTWPPSVFGLIFNDIAVDVSAINGIEESIPYSIVNNIEYLNSFSFDIKDNELVQNKNNLVVTAFLIDKETNRIINSNKCGINSAEVYQLEEKEEIRTREFYDLLGNKINNIGSGIYIVKDIFNNGIVKSKKILIP